MGITAVATLQRKLINRILSGFPGEEGWGTLNPKALLSVSGRRNWSAIRGLENKGGVYAFLFPAKEFSRPQTIQLDGPNRRQIPFQFTASHGRVLPGQQVVMYVGKASNLLQRFQWHFSLSKVNTGAQVQYGLLKCGKCRDRGQAAKFMLDHSIIAYRKLDGDKHVANRDILEVALWSLYMSPFNIKSER